MKFDDPQTIILTQPSEVKARLNNISRFSPCIKENTPLNKYKAQIIDVV
jgi:hypothetical protein